MLWFSSFSMAWGLVILAGLTLILLGYGVTGRSLPCAAMLTLLHAVALGIQSRDLPQSGTTCLTLAALLLLHGLSARVCLRQRHTRTATQARAS